MAENLETISMGATPVRKPYLYIFCFQTPAQRNASLSPGEIEESSQGIFIEAESPEQALAWGREISETYVQRLYSPEPISWKTQGFAHWVESAPKKDYPESILQRLPVVAYGSYPDPASFQSA